MEKTINELLDELPLPWYLRTIIITLIGVAIRLATEMALEETKSLLAAIETAKTDTSEETPPISDTPIESALVQVDFGNVSEVS